MKKYLNSKNIPIGYKFLKGSILRYHGLKKLRFTGRVFVALWELPDRFLITTSDRSLSLTPTTFEHPKTAELEFDFISHFYRSITEID